jgi:hypothetical protein
MSATAIDAPLACHDDADRALLVTIVTSSPCRSSASAAADPTLPVPPMMMNISASSGLFGFRVGQSTASLRHRDGNGPQSIERLQAPFRIARWAVDPVSARRRVLPAAEFFAAILRRCSDSPPGGTTSAHALQAVA